MKEKESVIFLHKVTAKPASSYAKLFNPGQVVSNCVCSHLWRMAIAKLASYGDVWAAEGQSGADAVSTLRWSALNRLCRQKGNTFAYS